MSIRYERVTARHALKGVPVRTLCQSAAANNHAAAFALTDGRVVLAVPVIEGRRRKARRFRVIVLHRTRRVVTIFTKRSGVPLLWHASGNLASRRRYRVQFERTIPAHRNRDASASNKARRWSRPTLRRAPVIDPRVSDAAHAFVQSIPASIVAR